MCIRDRDRTLQLDFRARASQVVGSYPFEHVYDVARLGNLPVSYTHLRAHETVLDLVCRLLLEKKQKPKYPYIREYLKLQ